MSRVSILARLWGRALRLGRPFLDAARTFQSSPGFGAGRYLVFSSSKAVSGLFQSSPGFGAGRYGMMDRVASYEKAFQSSPGFGAGRYLQLRNSRRVFFGFNPRPALGPGATDLKPYTGSQIVVSILARLWGRALQAVSFPVPDGRLFQSSPGFGAGRYSLHAVLPVRRQEFQSSPGFGAGRYGSIPTARADPARFNPRPALGPGATSVWALVTRGAEVSILARLWGRALLKRIIHNQSHYIVSILARLWGRALRP